MKTISSKPAAMPGSADDWVKAAAEAVPAPAGPMKRLTIDVSEDLHTRLKVGCARRRLKMADMLRELLDREFPPAAKS
jgi:ParG